MAIVDRIKGICLKPKDEWQVIAGESTPTANLLKNYALPLAAIGAVAGFIGMSFIGISVPFTGYTFRTPVVSGLIGAVVQVALGVLGAYLVGLIIDALAPQFGGEKNSAQAVKVAVYSFTPAWIAGVFALIPALSWLSLVGLYGIYLLYLGLMQLMKSPKEKAVGYTVVVVVCGIVIAFIVRFALGAIMGSGMSAAALSQGFGK